MTRRVLFATLLLALAFRPAEADEFVLSTGLDPTNNLISTGGVSDSRWQAASTGNFAQSVYPGNADWGGAAWLANGPNSAWIAKDASSSTGNTDTYTTTFDLTGYILSSAALQGSWTLDDAGTISLNGNSLGSLNAGDWGSLHSIGTVTSGFVQGVNTLSIQITQSDNFLEGVRFEGSVTAAQSSVPEPGPLTLAALAGSLGLAQAIRRRLRRR
jgi:hypothetical protein